MYSLSPFIFIATIMFIHSIITNPPYLMLLLTPRILSGELILGIIVYNKYNSPKPGTKGWIISKIIDANKSMHIYFIDDTRVNIECVQNLHLANITTYYIDKYNTPKENTTKYLLSIV